MLILGKSKWGSMLWEHGYCTETARTRKLARSLHEARPSIGEAARETNDVLVRRSTLDHFGVAAKTCTVSVQRDPSRTSTFEGVERESKDTRLMSEPSFRNKCILAKTGNRILYQWSALS